MSNGPPPKPGAIIKTTITVLGFLGVLVGIGITAGTSMSSLDEHDRRITSLNGKVHEVDEKVDEDETNIAVIKDDIEDIESDVKEIKIEQREQRTILMDIYRVVSDESP